MSAHVARVNPHHLRDKDNPRVVFEWVKRNEALLAVCEWDWTTVKDEAFHFADYQAAEEWIARTRGGERDAQGEERFYGAYATTAAGVNHGEHGGHGGAQTISNASGGAEANAMTLPRSERAEGSALNESLRARSALPHDRTAADDNGALTAPTSARPARAESKPRKGVAPGTGGTIKERIDAAKVNRRVAAERKANGTDAWRAVYRERVAPEDVYERTERRCGS